MSLVPHEHLKAGVLPATIARRQQIGSGVLSRIPKPMELQAIPCISIPTSAQQGRAHELEEAEHVASGGNLQANDRVPQAVVDGFLASSGHLGDRLIAAMRAGLAAGGEAGPIHSAGLKIVDRVSWPIADLRCDWTQDCPIEAIATLWGIYKPQLDAYVQRALNPDEAPSYGVPGDE